MSCLLSKSFRLKTCVQLRKLTVPSKNFFPRRTFNQPFRYEKKHQSHEYSLLKPTLFCLTVSSGAIVLAAIVQYERLQKSVLPISLQEYYRKNFIKENNIMTHQVVTSYYVVLYVRKVNMQSMLSLFRTNDDKVVKMCICFNKGLFSNLKKQWKKIRPSEKIFGTILFFNALVFLAWQMPRWQGTMVKYFTTDAFARKIPVSSLLLSAFSHSSVLHLSFNMFALHSFCIGLIEFGDMTTEEFSAMYISSCVVSSLASIVFRRSIKTPGISLGASGAILSLVGFFSISNPDERLSLIFLPTFSFEAIYALYGIISLDVCGLILRWKMFDHAAHLGGTIFGILWYKYISMYIWDNRKHIVHNWIDLKQKFKTKG